MNNLNRSKTLNYNNTTEVEKYMSDICKEMFNVIRHLLRSNKEMLKLINENYEKGILFYLNMIPSAYCETVFNTYEIIKGIIVEGINLRGLLNVLNTFDMQKFNIDTRDYIKIILQKCLLVGETTLDYSSEQFMNKLIEKLNNIFICLNYIIANPDVVLQNAESFLIDDDKVFN